MSKGFSDTILIIKSGSREFPGEVIKRFMTELEAKLDKYNTDEYLNEQFIIMAEVRIGKEGELEANHE